MSSHHIVRDEQEPALLICRADTFDYHIVQSLLEWSPVVVVTSEALPEVLTWQIKIDALICEAQNAGIFAEKLAYQMPISILSTSEPPQTYGLNWLINKGHKAINLLQTIDNQVLILLNDYAQKIDLVLYHHNKRAVFVPRNFNKWLDKGVNLSVCAPSGIKEYKNLIINSPEDFIVAKEGFSELKSDASFWLIEPLTQSEDKA